MQFMFGAMSPKRKNVVVKLPLSRPIFLNNSKYIISQKLPPINEDPRDVELPDYNYDH